MITVSSISSCVFLTTILSFPLSSYAGVLITHVTTYVGATCSNVCLSHGLKCYDNIIQEMSCSSAAKQVCSSSSLSDASGTYHCDKGGCYVGCGESVYASRGTQYWTCNTQPICHVAADNAGDYHNYLQVCPCAQDIDDSEDATSIHLLAWQIMGLLFFFSCCALGAVQLIAILFPDLFPSKESVYQKMGFEDSKQTWGEYGQQVLISLKSTGDSIKNMFTGKSSSSGDSVHSGVTSSDSASDAGSDVEDPSARARRERKERRSKKKRGQHSALSDLDDSVDM